MNTSTQTHVQGTGSDLLDARTSGYIKAYAVTAILNAVIVLLKEKIDAVHELLAIVGHHWVGHGILVVVIFFALGTVFTSQNKEMSGATAVSYLIWSTLIGGGIVALFFLIGLF
jgi:hypothetical protein